MKKQGCFILLSVLAATVIRAQQFSMLPLPNQQKLPQSEVYRVFEDSEGYMWYATQGAGLCRDNGYQVDVFRSDRYHPDLLRSNAVTCIAENVAQHEIWFGSKQGAYVLSKQDYQVRPLADIKSHVHAITQSPDGIMWLAANKQVKAYLPTGELQDSFALSWKGRPMGVESMTLDSHGTLWLMQWDGGVQTIDTRTHQLSTMNWEEAAGPTSLAEDSLHHYYYVGTWGAGIFRYDGQHAEPLSPELTTAMQRRVRSVHYDKWRHMLWAVTMAGLYAYTIEPDGSLKSYPINSLGLTPQQAIYRLTFDHQGNLWVPGTTPLTFILRPTQGSGVKRTSLDGLTQQTGVRVPIGKFLSEGHYCWMWSDRTQLMLYDLQTGHMSKATGTTDEETTRFGDIMTRRQAGGIWCATGKHLYRCEHHNMQVVLSSQPVVVMEHTISALCESPDGKLFIGTGNGLYRYDPESGKVVAIAEGIHTVRDIVVVPSGRVFFISVTEGLCVSQGTGNYQSLAPYQRFTSLAYSSNGVLWVGNAFGDVWRMDSTLHHVPVASSRESNGVKQLLCDSLNNLWVMGDTYLIEYHPDSDRRRLFRSNDYLVNLDNFGGISLTDEGNILVAGSGGLLTFAPMKLDDQDAAPLPTVAAYTVDGQKRLLSTVQKSIELPSSVVTLQLELTDFNYLKANNQQFAYRLRGLSDQWVELAMGDNTLQIVNLPKGHYVLELKVCDSYAHWGEPVEALTIDRVPAWYETWLAYLCYLLLALSVIGWGIHLYLKRSKQQAKRQMDEQLTEMKLRFFTNVSHELRTPLSLIITPLESIVKKTSQPETSGTPSTLHAQLKGILKHANELLNLVNRLLDFRKMDLGEMKLHPSPGDLLEFIHTCVGTFTPIAEGKGVSLQLDTPEGTLYTDFDPKAMQHIMYNLLSNALKYTEKGSVSVTLREHTPAGIEITVKDTGTGIDASELPKIFERYYQASNATDSSVPGTGIGLSMVKELVEQMGGTIRVNSKLGEGTTFTVTLPLSKEATATEEQLPESPVNPKLPSLLVADDNDDFRDFLVQELKDDYNILQARNGREALQLAQTHYVDVVLSDVMMPQMDGNELCRRLRQDESTSHIFVMLLTAKTAEESRMQGYESGADYYLTKPFNLDLLRNRLRHLSQMQERRIQMLAKASVSESDETEDDLRISPVDRKFMDKMKQVMEHNLNNCEFSVDVFCAEMAMSRMNFYRKMHALTGLTPAQYINDYRLTLADRMLREGVYNVSEVADRTGFATASYFSKCYKAKFGISPKDVRSK